MPRRPLIVATMTFSRLLLLGTQFHGFRPAFKDVLAEWLRVKTSIAKIAMAKG